MEDLQKPFDKIRNIAIIAHVDHGKTTLVDHLLKQSGLFKEHENVADRVMDSMDLERERGITIAAKNTSVFYKDFKINIIDTPGHSDFGGEVERILNMVDGAVLLVDASEGPLPQTRFVLEKALKQKIKVIVCINKIDRPDSRINEVHNEIFDLFMSLDAPDEQADFDCIYAVAKDGFAVLDPDDRDKGKNLMPLYDMIVEKLPHPTIEKDKGLKSLVSNIDYSEYLGRLAVAKVKSGTISIGEEIMLLQDGSNKKLKISGLFQYEGLKKTPVKTVIAGDIAIIAGANEINIGDTLSCLDDLTALTRLDVDAPTIEISLSVNNSPFAGKEGKFVTSRKIYERLEKELLYNVSIQVLPTERPEVWRILGRGELQLALLVEQMRREGFEMMIGKPQVVLKEIDGQKHEVMENIVVDTPSEYTGVITEKLGTRKGIMTNMITISEERVRLEFSIPARGLIGYRSEFLTDTRGMGLLSRDFAGYEPFKGKIDQRKQGALISDRAGAATPYALFNLEARGKMFITPSTQVYQGMIVGEHTREGNLDVNIIRGKKLTNVRASGTDENVKLTTVKPMSIEEALEWVRDDELIEITPLNIRLRCKELEPHKRKGR